MMSLREYRNKAAHLADFLPWAALVGEGVVLNKDGSFQRTARFRGPDLDSATPAELVATTSRLNGALRRLGSGWAIFVEAQRTPALDYPDNEFPDPVSALVDMERREQFREEGAHFETAYYLTLLWLPPAEEAARAEGWLYEGRSTTGVDPWEMLAGFTDRSDRVLNLVEGFVPEVRWLDDAETLTYLHSTVSTRRQRVRVPETPMHLDALLADEPLIGGLEPKLGDHHLRTLTITGFPSVTFPGLLDELNRLAFEYRWSTRAIMLDKTDATKLLSRIRRQWFAKRKSVAAILKEVMTNEASALIDSDASNKAADADTALQELGADYVAQMLSRVGSDIAASILQKLPLDLRETMLSALPHEKKSNLEEILSYPPGSAGALMSKEFFMVPADWTIREATEHLQSLPQQKKGAITYIYVVDKERRIEGILQVRDLILCSHDKKLSEIASFATHNSKRPVFIFDSGEPARTFIPAKP